MKFVSKTRLPAFLLALTATMYAPAAVPSVPVDLPASMATTMPYAAPAEDLPALPKSGSVTVGVLPNGVNYYIVTTPACKGSADVALVQKAGTGDEQAADKGYVTVHTRGGLTSLKHFTACSPFEFLKKNAIFPSESGYARISSDATVYRFENIRRDMYPEAVDSTLLFVFDLIDMGGDRIGELYSPANQAIIVAGDVDADAIKGKMNMLSMLISRKGGQKKTVSYEWKDSEGPVVKAVHSWTENRISAEYRSPRIPEGQMATVLPLMTSRYAASLGIVLKRRLATALTEKGIPFSDIAFNYESGADKSGDELVRVSVDGAPGRLEETAAVMAEVLSRLDSDGVSPGEYGDMESELELRYTASLGDAVIENTRHVDRCVSAFLYGASLADGKDELNFFKGRMIDPAVPARLFNDFVSALLDKSRNLTLTCETMTDAGTEDRILSAFENAWGRGKPAATVHFAADTTSLQRSAGKIKLKLENPEPLFGGKVWTFSNGMKVVYKKLPGNGYFNYSWIMKTGVSGARYLGDGSQPYMAGLLRTFKVAGMSGENFSRMLLANGIDMTPKVSSSETELSGTARADRASLLVKALISIAEDRSTDRAAYEDFRRGRLVELEKGRGAKVRLDSIMDGGNGGAKILDDRLQDRAMNFYDDVFSRTGDGVLIIVGDIDEARLQKALMRNLGALKIEKAYSSRARTQDKGISGRETMSIWGWTPTAGMKLKSGFSFGADSYMAARIAAMSAREETASKVSSMGWNLECDADISMFPEECLTLYLISGRAVPSGMPASMDVETSSEKVLEAMRSAIRSAARNGVSESGLARFRNALEDDFSSRLQEPDFICRMLALRYVYGKDLVSDYKKKIASVTAAQVREILSDLPKGGVAEYVVEAPFREFSEVPVRDAYTLAIKPVKPAEGRLYYPYDGSSVPTDTIRLDSLVNLPVLHFENDTTNSFRAVPMEKPAGTEEAGKEDEDSGEEGSGNGNDAAAVTDEDGEEADMPA